MDDDFLDDDIIDDENNEDIIEITLDEELTIYEDHIKRMWHNIIVPYLNDYSNREILYDIDENCSYKFHQFMIDNNKYLEQLIIDTFKET